MHTEDRLAWRKRRKRKARGGARRVEGRKSTKRKRWSDAACRYAGRCVRTRRDRETRSGTHNERVEEIERGGPRGG